MNTSESTEESTPATPSEAGAQFESEANKPPITLWQEFCYLIVHERKWWLIPILVSLGLIGIAVAFSSSPALPFIYTLF
jgi:hypothetical protein